MYPLGSRALHLVRDRYSPTVYGKEVMYSIIEAGDVSIADGILNNKYEVSRFKPVAIENQMWNEDPYGDIYWRFNYYNLEPVRNLLFAWQKTDNSEYKDKLISVTESFIDHGMSGPFSWDYHGAAFRAMTLIDVRQKLLDKHELTAGLDNKIVAAISVHGEFLADPAHFESDYNHGLDQSAALYLIATNFPNMKGANAWLSLASKRIAEMQNSIIDADGVLVENSPYYHLYVLEKFLEINTYLKQNHLTIDGFSEDKIEKMISYAVYMLQPNGSVPTIGASIGRDINLSGVYKELARSHPELLYVLTQGKQGVQPSKLNVQYQSSGETIMRSGWGRGDDYSDQTQLIFDVGEYRTNHSDLDALSFNLYGAGLALLPDAGLYSYDNGPYRSYFHGTSAHNTVVVDGKDQGANGYSTVQPKKVFPGVFLAGPGYSYQSGSHALYDGVLHQRAIVMIEKSTILIFDSLTSSQEHVYQQMFHMFPGATISSDGLTVTAQGDDPKQVVKIKQFKTEGVELQTALGLNSPPNGLCSIQYKVAIPCLSVSYENKGANVNFVTAITIGDGPEDINYENGNVVVNTDDYTYNISTSHSPNSERRIEVNKVSEVPPIISSTPSLALRPSSDWKLTMDPEGRGAVAIDAITKSIRLTAPSSGFPVQAIRNTSIDLSSSNLYFRVRTNHISDLNDLRLSFSNNNWSSAVSISVKDVIYYPNTNRDGEWLEFGVSKSDLRKEELGGWSRSDTNFDWSAIDAIKIAASSKPGHTIDADVKDFSIIPEDSEAKAVIVFDDGWSSVLEAAKIMNARGIKGNIAVISGSVGKKNYLTLDELRGLQNEFGWNMVSHSSLHRDAVKDYSSRNDIAAFESDISDSIQYMSRNLINTAPNWYIYPDGSVDASVKGVVGKYYKFARATYPEPISFPFPEPLEVGVFPVYSDRASVLDVHNAVSDAIKYNQTLVLMFHKISDGEPSVFTEWSKKDFQAVINDLIKQGIKIVTLSELDKAAGIPESIVTVHEAVPSQIIPSIISTSRPNSTIELMRSAWKWLVGRVDSLGV
jgi:hypothetical protein